MRVESPYRTPLPPRWAGVLLHPTSLPGPGATGTIGLEAHRWVDLLADLGFAAWQVLPLCPPGPGQSPYSSWSAMLGSPALVDLPMLADAGLLSEAEARPGSSGARTDPTVIASWHLPMLERAAERLVHDEKHPLHGLFREWESLQPWLADVAGFAARKKATQGAPWWRWPNELRSRSPEKRNRADLELARPIAIHRALAFLFDHQWSELRARAHGRGLTLIGDLPIYVSADSADCWARPDLFQLDRYGNPTVVAGCPPDAFSDLGQRWGNPMYRWEAHAGERFAWWVDRLARTLEHVDAVRIDHFRGFSAGWGIPASAPDARTGMWIPAPGEALFAVLRKELGGLPFIAEDLGQLDDAVHALRATTGLPGTRVLQFGFDGDPRNPHHPDRIERNAVACPGTHDNDTSASWFRQLHPDIRRRVVTDLGCDADSAARSLVGAALDCAAQGAVISAQDLLGLGGEARMNTPGVAEGNWAWRLTESDLAWLGEELWPEVLREAGRTR